MQKSLVRSTSWTDSPSRTLRSAYASHALETRRLMIGVSVFTHSTATIALYSVNRAHSTCTYTSHDRLRSIWFVQIRLRKEEAVVDIDLPKGRRIKDRRFFVPCSTSWQHIRRYRVALRTLQTPSRIHSTVAVRSHKLAIKMRFVAPTFLKRQGLKISRTRPLTPGVGDLIVLT